MARSAKTAKKNVKVTLKLNAESTAAINEIRSLGYTVKYKFYRSTKKASKYTAKLTKTSKSYLNTVGTKGSRYYYKAHVMVYDQDGKLVAYNTAVAYPIGIIFAIAMLALFIHATKKHTASQKA